MAHCRRIVVGFIFCDANPSGDLFVWNRVHIVKFTGQFTTFVNFMCLLFGNRFCFVFERIRFIERSSCCSVWACQTILDEIMSPTAVRLMNGPRTISIPMDSQVFFVNFLNAFKIILQKCVVQLRASNIASTLCE